MKLEQFSAGYKEPTPEEIAKKEKEAREPSIADIQGDAKKSHQFSEMLRNTGDAEDSLLAEHVLAGGPLNKADFQRAEKHRKEFLIRTEQVEQLQTLLTPEFLSVLPQKDFQNILKATGASRVKEVLARDLESFAMRNPEEFKKLYKKAEAYNGLKGKDQEKTETLQKIAEKYKLKEEKLAALFRETDPVKRQTLMEGFFTEIQRKPWLKYRRKKWADRASDWINDVEADIASQAPDVEKLLRDLASGQRAIGSALAISLEHPDMNPSLVKKLGGEDLEEPSYMEFADVKKHIPTATKAQEAFTKFRTDNKIPPWDTLTPAQQDAHLSEFSRELSKDAKGKLLGRGGWAEWLLGDSVWEMVVKGYGLA